jgi:hypothetical protein
MVGELTATEPRPSAKLEKFDDRVEFKRYDNGKPIATYVFKDQEISRPYIKDVLGRGVRTRNHPPIAGKDATDHAAFHPGIFLAFGDLSGHDYWRLKAKVVHDGFVREPSTQTAKAGFTVRNRYLSTDGSETVCIETCTISLLEIGYLVWDSTFEPAGDEIYFGDQEEMGLGMRLATPLSVKGGGEIRDSVGRKNEKEIWGTQSAWCAAGRDTEGLTLIPHPGNFRPSFFHARDYGVIVANPFGVNAFTKGPKNKTIVRKGESLRLRFIIALRAIAPWDQHAYPAALIVEAREDT